MFLRLIYHWIKVKALKSLHQDLQNNEMIIKMLPVYISVHQISDRYVYKWTGTLRHLRIHNIMFSKMVLFHSHI